MNIHISRGNTKLGRILNINLPPIHSCKKDVPCKSEGCYALKAWRQYPNVRRAWSENLDLALSSYDKFFCSIVDTLRRKRKLPFFRWHSSGDILDQKYLDYMSSVAQLFPQTRFLAFTKRNDLDVSNMPENLTIRYSFWPNYKAKIDASFVNYAGLYGDSRVNGGHICQGNCQTCKICWSKSVKNVIFHKH